MIKMEIALFLVISFLAGMYFSAERKKTELHRVFGILLVAVMVNLVFDLLCLTIWFTECL